MQSPLAASAPCKMKAASIKLKEKSATYNMARKWEEGRGLSHRLFFVF